MKMIKKEINSHITAALKEDNYQNDLTTKLVSNNSIVTAKIISKQSFYIYGLHWMKAIFKKVDKNLKVGLVNLGTENSETFHNYLNNFRIVEKIDKS